MPTDNPDESVIEKIKPPAFREIVANDDWGYDYITDYQAISSILAKLPAYASFPQFNDYLLLAEQAKNYVPFDNALCRSFHELGVFIIKFEGYEKRYADKAPSTLGGLDGGYYYSFKGCLDNSRNLDYQQGGKGELTYSPNADALNAYAFYLKHSPLTHTNPVYKEIKQIHQTLSLLKNKHITAKEAENLRNSGKLGHCNS